VLILLDLNRSGIKPGALHVGLCEEEPVPPGGREAGVGTVEVLTNR